MSDILTDIDDLIKQATTERSHHYTADVLKRARREIVLLREGTFNLLQAVQVRNDALEDFENGRRK